MNQAYLRLMEETHFGSTSENSNFRLQFKCMNMSLHEELFQNLAFISIFGRSHTRMYPTGAQIIHVDVQY